ncbi:type I polyketide synthase [Longimicrobium sp.]|uniref:type I polyketide synthase n=1 Tax=Longimicrobium sp. TaxID=2029185 RepID=UPI002E31BCC5|nr:beta-ketoacyl synthase N-terminal-like domain-containing protein [Longimicrobium sp.]HEX6040953.1 beta-ketoacyl synthase N-terminal-like domain-containing protein [Longimicrobium sp.]
MSEQYNDPAQQAGEFDVAIIGMAARVPGADDLDTFWDHLRAGRETITHFTPEELRAAGVPDEVIAYPGYVPSAGRLNDIQTFDAGFFGYSPREAEVLEPAHRLFLEVAWEALENAGWAPERVEGRVGVYAGAGAPMYTESHVRPNAELMASVGAMQSNLASGKDFIATRTAYKLGLRGPALSVQTACSTSLVAVHLAVQSLLSGESDMALAGGASVLVPQDSGYVHAPGSILSPDGHCRAFDAQSAGTLSGSGVGVVVLKRLADALRDGDPVRAVIKGSAVNNDGGNRVAYTAPGVEGQSAVISEALAAADVHPDTIGYVEAHGSGTDLGDTIEIAALTRAYRAHTDRVGFCAVGAVKSNVGHLDTAAGVTGLIKTVLALEHGEIPPTVHFTAPNPKLEIERSPFFVSGELRRWETDGHPRRAAVSSFGIGGTNAHVILEEAPPVAPSGPSRPWQTLRVSARSPKALDAATDRLAEHLSAHPELPLADVAFTLIEGRRAFPYRRTVVVREGEDAARLLRERAPERTVAGLAEGGSRSVAFLFPGLGDHYPNMARGLYEAEPAFGAEVDACARILQPLLGMDIREAIFSGPAPSDAAPAGGIDLRGMLGRANEADPAADRLNRTELAQPAVFVIDYAMAKLWMSWGVVPEAVIGHSLGEYAAACIAGILPLEDALALVADRARMIHALPAGAMLAVSLDESAARAFLTPELAVATVNAPGLTVLSGPEGAIADAEQRIVTAGHTARRLATTHAFHSPMMAPVAEQLAARIARTTLRAPSIPMISNVTGTWIRDAEATDPGYWTRHLLGTVRFADGIAELLREPGRVLIEVGPGQTLSTFVRQRPPAEDEQAPLAIVPSLRYAYDRKPDAQFLAEAVGRLWVAGVAVDGAAFRAGERRCRVQLPTYPWEKQRYWVDAPAPSALADRAASGDDLSRRADPADWTYLPTWTRTASPSAPPERHGVLLVGAPGPLTDRLESALERAGQRVTLLHPGAGYSAGRRTYYARMDSRDDFRALGADFRDTGLVPDVVIFAGALEDARGAFGTLMLLADAMAMAGEGRLVVLTAGAHAVTGDEEVSPAAAALLGAARVVPQEYPALRCRAIDVAPGDASPGTAARVAAEAVADAADFDVAFRGRHRWTRGFRAVRPSAPALAVRDGSAFVLVGSMEGRMGGLALALARPGVRIALVTPDDGDAELTRMLEARGAQVLALRADAADSAALADALASVEDRSGSLETVIFSPHGASIGEFAGIASWTPEWTAALADHEARHMALAGALEDRGVRHVLVDVTIAGVTGTVARVRMAAAHALSDGFAAARRWTAVDWDHWTGGQAGEEGIAPDEVPAAVDAVLALAGEPQVVVSVTDVEARVRALAAAARAASDAAPGATLYERPELDVEYHAPTNEVEETLAALWQGLLGIERVGIHDDFFGLGGHSLLATQIVARVRDQFQLDLPLQSIFEAPTIAKFAQLIEDAIIAELEALSEEEAAGLMGA